MFLAHMGKVPKNRCIQVTIILNTKNACETIQQTTTLPYYRLGYSQYNSEVFDTLKHK